MSYLLDGLSGSAAAALVGHAPDVGSTWLGDAGHMYPPSDIRLTGTGYTYNGSPSAGVSSLLLNPTTYTGTSHVVYADFLFKTLISTATSGVPLFSNAASPVDCRFYYSDGLWKISRPGLGALTAIFAFPAADTVIRARMTISSAATRTGLFEVSADGGATYSTLFSGIATLGDTTSIPDGFAPGIWYDLLNTPTTGVLVGRLLSDPPAAPANATLTGPTTGSATFASANFTVTLDSAAGLGGKAIALADSSGGNAFAGANVAGTTLTIPVGLTSATFTYTRATAGTSNLSISGSGLSISGSPIAYVAAAVPTTCAVTGSATPAIGTPSTYTYTLNSVAPPGGISITPQVGTVAGSFATTPVVIASGSTVGTSAFTASGSGSGTISGSASGITFTPQSITVSSGSATAFTLTGPSSGFANNVSTNFTVTPVGGIETGVFTPTPVGGVTFAPTTLTWSGDASAKTFTIVKVAAGAVSINGTFSNGITPPSPVAYTFNPQTLAASPGSIPASATTTVTFTEAGGKFLSSAPVIGASGVFGLSVGTISVVDDTHATAPVTAGATTGTVTYTDTSVAASPTATQAVAPVVVDGLFYSSVTGFTPGLSTVTYRVYNVANSPISIVISSGITEINPGQYAASVTITGNVAGHVKWNSGEGSPVTISDIYNPPSATATISGTISANVVQVNGLAAQEGDFTASAAGSNTITIPSDQSHVGWKARVLRAATGAQQSKRIIASNTSSGVQTLDSNWATVPTGTPIIIELTAPVTTDFMTTDVITSNAVSAGAVTEIQAGLATPTNITAGSITSVGTTTNLTNAPSAGDFTATMKTSLATTAVGNVTLAASQPFYAPAKVGDSMSLLPTAANSIMIEANYNLKQAMKVILAACSNIILGNGTTAVTVGGAALPTPTPGANTVINATMTGVLLVNGVPTAVDRTAITGIQLSTA